MKHKVSELDGALLDAAVSLAEGWEQMPNGQGWCVPTRVRGETEWFETTRWGQAPHPWSTDWSQGGPIIERERIDVTASATMWAARMPNGISRLGTTPLVAAMRAYVASKLGDELDLPRHEAALPLAGA